MLLSHISLQCQDFDSSARFYDAVLEPLGGSRIMDMAPHAIGYGRPGPVPAPEFWIGPVETGDGFRESHVAFAAATRADVDAFFAVATAAGAEVLHAPRLWPEYSPTYYGAFVRDPDGNNVEACCMAPE